MYATLRTIAAGSRSRRVLATAVVAAAGLTGALAVGAQAYPGGTFAQPDLVVSKIEPGSRTAITVGNIGNRASGMSHLSVSGHGTFWVPQLEAGSSYRVQLGSTCEGSFTATADSLREVTESNESNNSKRASVIC